MTTPVPAPAPGGSPSTRSSLVVLILAVLLVLAVLAAAVCAFGWFSATRPKAVPAQVKVVGSAGYTTATVTASTAAGSSSDSLDASGDNRNTYLTVLVGAGDVVTVTVSPVASGDPATATVGCQVLGADGTTVLSEQTGLRGTQAVCTWRNL
jgi:hypothetical protein